jgi:3-oxoacyl-[acyl-carrier-protein] synthase-3
VAPAPAVPPLRRTAGIVGIGAVSGGRSVPTSAVAERVGVDEAWILRRTGIAHRHHAAPGETTASLAVRAGADALADARAAPADVDLVLLATMSPDQATPNVAPIVADELGLNRAGALDVGAACAGFVGGLVTAAAHVESGRADTVLLIGADRMSSLLDPTDRRTAPLFGDGAGAVVLRADAGARLGASRLGADGSLREAIAAPLGGTMTMDGHVTFQAAIALMSAAVREVCEAEGLTPADLDLFVPHQANARITLAVGERLGLRPEQVVDVIARAGNTSNASIPSALAQARGEDRLHGRAVIAGVGAGFNYGAVAVDWTAA